MEKILFLILCCLLNALCETTTPDKFVTLETKLGKLKGTVIKTEKGRDFQAFTGIPFAKPPVGELRFEAPVPANPWGPAVFDATKPGSECPQPNIFVGNSFTGDEDCLNLNVYSPNTKKGASLPVMVFIHGGGFVLGSGGLLMYGPHRFIERDVVFVTIQYRIGLLGFLNTEDTEATGNYGMLDQVLALRWVRENIDQFGGDKRQITIFGESAGGASVMYHLVSPLSKGLFDRAIAQSGSTLTRWAHQKEPLEWAKQVAAGIDCPTDTTKNMVECFRRKTAADLVEGNNKLLVTGLMPFNAAPSVDVLAEQAFLPKDPLILLQEGTVNVVPVIAGIMEHEGYAFYCDMARTFKLQGDDFFNTKNAGKYFPSILDVEPEMTTVFNRIKEEYFGDKDCNDPDTFELTLAKAIGDITFDAGIARSVDLLSKAGVPIRTYIYNQISNLSMVAFFGGKRGKYVSHGDEIFQQFVAQLPGFAEKTKEDKKMANIMSSIWTKFAYGSFDNLVTSDNEVIEWPIYAEQKPYHLLLNIQPSVREGRISDKVDFWGNIIPKLVNNHRAKDEL